MSFRACNGGAFLGGKEIVEWKSCMSQQERYDDVFTYDVMYLSKISVKLKFFHTNNALDSCYLSFPFVKVGDSCLFT